MLKRQDTGLSSSRREMPAPPPSNNHHHNAKSVGCMSGIFHLLSKYQHRHRRKFLTFGKKHDKVVQYPPSTKQNPTTKKVPQHDDDVIHISPSIQPEIRKSTTSSHSPEVQLRSSPPSLLPRIIKSPESKPVQSNLEISTTTNTDSTISYEERRKLVFDLEKCDEDLKELQRIIESVRYSGRVLSPSPAVNRAAADEKSRGEREDVRIKYSVVNEQPSPVSVLDELTRSPLISNIYLRRETTTTKNGRMATPQPHKATPRRKDEANLNSLFVQKFTIESVVQARRRGGAVPPPPPRSSKAMMESVEEVCKDIAWGEKREVGRLGIVIQDYICRDLIEEFVKDLDQQHSSCNNANFFLFTALSSLQEETSFLASYLHASSFS